MKKLIKEIEVKAKIRDKKILLSSLKKLGIKLSPPITQKDRVFLPNGISYEDIKPGVNCLRIRQEDKRVLFTLKQRQQVELSSLERETQIENPQVAADIINLLGFYEWVCINKKRKKAKFKKYEICLDEVEGLGTFIEIEKMSSGNDLEVQEELFKFLESLGISRDDRERRGYDTLIYYKDHPNS